jgi:hypothetical protein
MNCSECNSQNVIKNEVSMESQNCSVMTVENNLSLTQQKNILQKKLGI